jgi:hypothetical protein
MENENKDRIYPEAMRSSPRQILFASLREENKKTTKMLFKHINKNILIYSSTILNLPTKFKSHFLFLDYF